MATLILSPRETADSRALAEVARQAGIDVLRVPHRHFSRADLPCGPCFLYGEPWFAGRVAEMRNLSLLDVPADWLPRLPWEYRLREVRSLPLAEARRAPGPVFAKGAVLSRFPSAVYSCGRKIPNDEPLPGDMPVLLSEPVDWAVEFRCFVLHRAILTLSIYFRDGYSSYQPNGTWPGEPAEKNEALAFGTKLLADRAVSLPAAVVLDLGRIAGRGWAVVEANPAWCSAIYGCDPAGALAVVRRACRSAATLTPQDQPWIDAGTTHREPGCEPGVE